MGFGTPPLHHSITPSLHHSIPLLHHAHAAISRISDVILPDLHDLVIMHDLLIWLQVL
jgi:hypothetical protein